MPECVLCSREFKATSPRRRYCSDICRRRRWELANPLKKRAGEWVWQARNRGRIATTHRAWYLANRDRALEASRNWSHMNRARKAAFQRGRAAKLSATEWSEEELARAKALLRGTCAYCGTTENLTFDHIIPLSRGGEHQIGNLVAACKPCNSRKHAKDELEFRALLALEAFIDGRRGGVGEDEAPYRVTCPCRRPRHRHVRIRDRFVAARDEPNESAAGRSRCAARPSMDLTVGAAAPALVPPRA